VRKRASGNGFASELASGVLVDRKEALLAVRSAGVVDVRRCLLLLRVLASRALTGQRGSNTGQVAGPSSSTIVVRIRLFSLVVLLDGHSGRPNPPNIETTSPPVHPSHRLFGPAQINTLTRVYTARPNKIIPFLAYHSSTLQAHYSLRNAYFGLVAYKYIVPL
jgi:hypothetical protein